MRIHVKVRNLLVGVILIALVCAATGVLSADTKTPPGKPAVSSVTAADRQLTVNWNAASAPSDKPVVDYQVTYRAGSSGDWTNTATYSLSYDSGDLTGEETTWSHQQDPLNLGTPTGGNIAAYVAPEPFTTQNGASRTGLYKVKQAVALMRIQVSGTASVQTTIRLMYSATKPVSLAYSGSELARADSTGSGNAVSLSFVASDLPANSFFWIDGYDRTIESGNLKLTATTISDRRLLIDIATLSTALNTNISGLTNQQSYQVRVRARNSDGWGAWSDASSATPLGTPDAPTGLSSVSGNQQLALSWSAPTNTGGYAISDYDIQYRAQTGQTWGQLDRLAREHGQHRHQHDDQQRHRQRHELPGPRARREQRRRRRLVSIGHRHGGQTLAAQLRALHRPTPAARRQIGSRRTALDGAQRARQRQRRQRLRPPLPRIGHEHLVHLPRPLA